MTEVGILAGGKVNSRPEQSTLEPSQRHKSGQGSSSPHRELYFDRSSLEPGEKSRLLNIKRLRFQDYNNKKSQDCRIATGTKSRMFPNGQENERKT